jgi:membrane-associated protein
LYKKKDSKFFRQEHLRAAASFYTKYGGLASAAALFFPITRSFAPVVAGILKMKFARFVLFSLAGSILWVTSFVMAGYLIGSIPALKRYIPYIIILIIVVVTIPIVTGVIRKLNKAGGEKIS